MKLSDQLEQDHECGDYGNGLDGYSQRAKQLEEKATAFDWLEEQWKHYDIDVDYDIDGCHITFDTPMTRHICSGSSLLEAVNQAMKQED